MGPGQDATDQRERRTTCNGARAVRKDRKVEHRKILRKRNSEAAEPDKRGVSSLQHEETTNYENSGTDGTRLYLREAIKSLSMIPISRTFSTSRRKLRFPGHKNNRGFRSQKSDFSSLAC